MANYDLSGTTSGSGVSSGSAALSMWLSGGTAGSATTSQPSPLLTLLLSGGTAGFSVVLDNTRYDIAGSTGGQAILAPAFLHWTHNLSGATAGYASLLDAGPLPVHGLSVATGFAEVTRAPRPVNCPPRAPKFFRWGQTLTRGDLSLFITDLTGSIRISPFEVTYALYQVLRGGALHLVGPACRKPVMASVGEYYVVWNAGELGQPGDWVVKWSYRRSFNASVITETHPFRVLDAATAGLAGDFSDPTCRKKKYGWE